MVNNLLKLFIILDALQMYNPAFSSLTIPRFKGFCKDDPPILSHENVHTGLQVAEQVTGDNAVSSSTV